MDRAVVSRPHVAEVVIPLQPADAESEGEGDQGGYDNRQSGAPQAPPAQEIRTEGVQIQRSLASPSWLDEGEQRRQQQEHRHDKEEDSGSGEETELPETGEIGHQECVEGGRGGDSTEEHANPRVSPQGVHRLFIGGSGSPLLHVAGIENDDKVDAKANYQPAKGRGQRVNAAEGDGTKGKCQSDPGDQREEGEYEGGSPPEGKQEQEHHPGQRRHQPDHDVRGDEPGIIKGYDVSTRELHLRRIVAAFLAPRLADGHDPLGETRHEHSIELQVLGRAGRFGHHQEESTSAVDQAAGFRIHPHPDSAESDLG